MNRFDYVRPATVAEAVAAAAQPGSAYLAAGTNLLDLMKGGVMRPARLVDLARVPGLDVIEALPDGGVRIGARVRNSDLAYDPGFARRFPAVARCTIRVRTSLTLWCGRWSGMWEKSLLLPTIWIRRLILTVR